MLKNKILKTVIIILAIIINCVIISALIINIKSSVGEIQSENISEQEATNNFTNSTKNNILTEVDTIVNINNYKSLTLDAILKIILMIIGIILIIISVLIIIRLK